MPEIVGIVLQQRLRRSGLWDELNKSCAQQFGGTLALAVEDNAVVISSLKKPLLSGAVSWGVLYIDPPSGKMNASTAQHWLDAAAERIDSELRDSSMQGSGIVPGSITRTTAYLRRQFREPIRLADAANRVQLSRERLSRLFRQSLGITFSEYLCGVRVREACTLLRTTRRPIREIGFDCGFRSVSQFNRSFRQMQGCSPRRFRSQ